MHAYRKTWNINLYVNLPPSIVSVKVVEVKNKLEKLLKE